MRTAGIVLAGGLSRRFGSPKAFARIGNEFFYERATYALEPHCVEVIIVTQPELMERYPAEVRVITDIAEVAGFGPLAGILSAMESVEADRYVVLPCDMPYVDNNVIEKLTVLHEKGVTAVVADGRFHPLVSVWDSELKCVLIEMLRAKQFKVMDLLRKLNVTWIDGSSLTKNEKAVFVNVNTPTDLERSGEGNGHYR